MGWTMNCGAEMALLMDKKSDSCVVAGALPGTPRATGSHALLLLSKQTQRLLIAKHDCHREQVPCEERWVAGC